jgi:hypothetical protein
MGELRGAGVTAFTPDRAAEAVSLPQLAPAHRVWSRRLSQAVSAGLLLAVLFQLRHVTPRQLHEALPDTPLFLPALFALYLIPPAADWVIFRRLWRLPMAGLPVLLGKRIANEILMYSGEAYFCLWARRQPGLTAAPFGTIKDVNILSALVGNLLALVLVVAALPFLSSLSLGAYAGAAVGSAAVMLGVSATVLLFSRRLFTLSAPQLLWVSWIHLARLIAGVLLWAILGRLAIPEAAPALWLALSTVRLLVARLPLAPNKDLVFAAVATLLVGEDHAVAAFVAMTSMAITALHLLFGGGLALAAFLGAGGSGRLARRRRAPAQPQGGR